ncbi:MAG: SRPBCC family protein [Actinobacteria bacterium]|nr:MAG: SRPBCC family protein [Actinomycetota bacterium]
MQKTGDRGANALKHDLIVRVEATSRATTEAVYSVLADLSSHAVWAGDRQRKRTRLLTIEAPTGSAVVGTEFDSTGSDPMGSFSDRSVVTEATPGKAFEFVTEARLTTKKGISTDWTNVERYELEPAAGGCLIVCTSRVTRISELPGMLGIFNLPGLRAIGLAMSAKISRRSVRNLARVAEERAEGQTSRGRTMRAGSKLFVGALTAGAFVLAGPASMAAADVGSATATPASCMGIEAATLSPPGSSAEAPGGMRDVKAFLDENFPGVPPGLAFYSFAARLHEGSHEACDEALGG